ncbi:MAG TPA: hypothetical protein VEL05_03215 [Candidatus Acidoferrum sp.]|nr:hypothetical protein [Candidatus Acidoferrum sp.]
MSLLASTPAMAQTSSSSAAALPASAPPATVIAPAPRAGSMDNVISAFGLLSYWYSESGLGVGGRYQKTLVPEGWLHIPTVHDDFGLEGGADFIHYSFFGASYNEVAVVVGGVWNFWFAKDRLALYPKVDMGYRFGSWSAGSTIGGYGGLILQGSAGIAYRVAPVTLRAELGSGSLRLGAGFAF